MGAGPLTTPPTTPRMLNPHIPQSNPVSERLNRVLNETIRAMLYSANMPDVFWADAAVTAAYIGNRLPTYSHDKSPYELLILKLI
jgi:hypothetical protein